MSIDAIDIVCGLSRVGFPRPPEGRGTDRDSRLVMFVLAHHASDVDGQAFPSRNTLAAETGLRRSVVSECLDALELATWIVDTGHRMGRGVKVWRVLPDRWQPDGQTDRRASPDNRTGKRTDNRTGKRTGGPGSNRTERNKSAKFEPTPQRTTEPTGTECVGCTRNIDELRHCPLKSPDAEECHIIQTQAAGAA